MDRTRCLIQNWGCTSISLSFFHNICSLSCSKTSPWSEIFALRQRSVLPGSQIRLRRSRDICVRGDALSLIHREVQSLNVSLAREVNSCSEPLLWSWKLTVPSEMSLGIMFFVMRVEMAMPVLAVCQSVIQSLTSCQLSPTVKKVQPHECKGIGNFKEITACCCLQTTKNDTNGQFGRMQQNLGRRLRQLQRLVGWDGCISRSMRYLTYSDGAMQIHSVTFLSEPRSWGWDNVNVLSAETTPHGVIVWWDISPHL